MPLTERRADVTWEGNLTEGKGLITRVSSGAFPELPVSWPARTQEPDGKTSPEELIAAAHASCFSMALSNELNKIGHAPQRLDVSATCVLDRIDGKTTITQITLDVRGFVQGIDEAQFEQAAQDAKQGCPVSRALMNNVDIKLNASLRS